MPVDQRDRAVFHLAGCIPLGVDVADLLQFQRRFQRDRVVGAAAQAQHVAHAGHTLGQMADRRIVRQQLRRAGRQFQQRRDQCGLTAGADRAAGPACGDRDTGHCHQLRRERLCAGHADFGPGHRLQHHVAFARHRAFRHVQHAQHMLALAFHVAERGERIRRLTALADQKPDAAGRHGRSAVAQLAREIDVRRYARQLL